MSEPTVLSRSGLHISTDTIIRRVLPVFLLNFLLFLFFLINIPKPETQTPFDQPTSIQLKRPDEQNTVKEIELMLPVTSLSEKQNTLDISLPNSSPTLFQAENSVPNNRTERSQLATDTPTEMDQLVAENDDPVIDVETLTLGDCTGWTEIRKLNTDQKVVFLTFDAGSTLDAFSNILVALEKHQAKASFFLTGVWVERYPEETKLLAELGHDIYNHSYDHPDFKTLTDQQIHEQLSSVDELVKELTNIDSKPFFRPPYGSRDQRVVSTVCKEGYYTMYWNNDPLDWKSGEGFTTEMLIDKITNTLSPGSIYLLHLGSGSTEEGIFEIFEKIYEQGYSVMPLSKAFSVSAEISFE